MAGIKGPAGTRILGLEGPIKPRPRATRNRAPELGRPGSPAAGLAVKIARMRTRPTIILLLSAATTGGTLYALKTGALPLGVRGEWEWLRVPFAPSLLDVSLAAVGVAAFALFAGAGMWSLGRRPGRTREAAWLVALAFASVAVQAVAQSGAPVGYGLSKWVVAVHQRGASGYFTVAKAEAGDLPKFLADYPGWVRRQDALHIGTHPPGLIATEALLLHSLEAQPGLARAVTDLAPQSVAMTLRVYGQDNPMTPADRATVVVTGFLTLVVCGATVLPLYALARSGLNAPSAWATACLWPLAPSAVLFQPASDTAFPFVAASALALATLACRTAGKTRVGLAAASGVVLGLAMQFSLAFLAVGLVVGIVLVVSGGSTRRVVLLLAATGLGFLAVTLAWWAATGANPFAVWWWNQRNHARFYAEYSRTYSAWLVANPIELAVGLGIPATVWLLGSARNLREVPKASAATLLVLTLLTLSGRNLSEVARLWLPFLPALLIPAGAEIGREGRGAGPALALTVLLTGLQTLALQAMVQVVYPV